MSGTGRHVNIPIFIPHLGCPNDCVFCNQKKISGHGSFRRERVKEEIEQALSTVEAEADCEIAFFGGSFTGIDREEMISLLATAKAYIDCGRVNGIRLSTRPDYISDEILAVLRAYGVKTVELGIQSMDDGVLEASKRGHTAAQTKEACAKIKAYGFELVGQMMIGLPSSSAESEKETARRICEMGADGARIYPTVVLRDTALADLAEEGTYQPLTTDQMARRTAEALEIFAAHGVKVLRIGLQAADNLSGGDDVAAGEYHSAIGELSASVLYEKKLRAAIMAMGAEVVCGKELRISCPKGATSQVVGQKKAVKSKIQNEFKLRKIKIVENPALGAYNIRIEII